MLYPLPVVPTYFRLVAVAGLCMPTNECRKGRELLAAGQLVIKNYPNTQAHYPTPVQASKPSLPLFSVVHQTKGLLFILVMGLHV